MKLETEFDLFEKVYIAELKIWGKILAIHLNSSLTYYVRYFDGKDPKECYFYGNELSRQETETMLES